MSIGQINIEPLTNKKNINWLKANAKYNKFCNTIEKYNLLESINNVVFLYSGGKDATFGLYFLNKYIMNYYPEINLKAIMVTYPAHVYFEENGEEADCFKRVREFCASQNVDLDVFTSDNQDLTEGAVDGCKICKATRKEILDGYLQNIGENGKSAIVTGYTLYDILAYLDEYCLLTNFTFDMTQFTEKKITERITNCLHKMNVKEELPGGFRIIRPLVDFKESDVVDFLNDNSIPYINRPCKVSSKKHKRIYFEALNLVESMNNSSYEGIMDFLSKHNIELPKTFNDIQYKFHFTDC